MTVGVELIKNDSIKRLFRKSFSKATIRVFDQFIRWSNSNVYLATAVYKRNRKWWSSGVPGCETDQWNYRLFGLYCTQKTNTQTDIWIFDQAILYNKKAVSKTLICRAERLNSSEANYKKEINRVQLALKNNGYPPALTTLSQFRTTPSKW